MAEDVPTRCAHSPLKFLAYINMLRSQIIKHIPQNFGIRLAEFTTEITQVVQVPRYMPTVAGPGKGPVHEFNYCSALFHLSKRSGIYILTGENEAYIGQGRNVSHRLEAHDTRRPKAFWDTAFICVTMNGFVDNHAYFLERLFILNAIAARKVELRNKQIQPLSGYSPIEHAECDYVFERFKELLVMVGCNVF